MCTHTYTHVHMCTTHTRTQLIAFFNELEGSLYISVAHVRILKFTFYILTTTHISACIWFPLACFTEGRSVHLLFVVLFHIVCFVTEG